jgi:hypothetical protein
MSGGQSVVTVDEYDPDGLPPVEALDAVASELRQAVLDVLLTADEEAIGLEGLAREIAGSPTAIEGTTTRPDSLERLKIALLHHHLPRLDDEEIVEFDVVSRTVESGPHIDDVEPLV